MFTYANLAGMLFFINIFHFSFLMFTFPAFFSLRKSPGNLESAFSA